MAFQTAMAIHAALLFAIFLLASRADPQVLDSDAVGREFEKFSADFGKTYTPEERAARLADFDANFRFIQEENAKGHGFELGLNGHADISHAEFLATRLGLRKLNDTRQWAGLPHLGTMAASGAALPAAVDWRKRGALTPVQNQGHCGGCWTFSAAGALSAAWQIETGSLVALSEQQFLDCTGGGTVGCHGGAMEPAFSYATSVGLCTAASYPYRARQGSCMANSGCDVAIPRGSVLGYRQVRSDSEFALMEAVAQQPVSVGIEAEGRSFRFYSAGIFSTHCGQDPNHAVLLVGYGVQAGSPYWLLKNSWGTDWGERGYFKLLRNEAYGAGTCGIMTIPSFPVVRGERQPSTSAPTVTTRASTTGAPPTGDYNYGRPPCPAHEVLGTVFGGEVCVPRCSFWGECPHNALPGVSAQPRCVLKGSSWWDRVMGRRYCALVCRSSSECGPGATCAGTGSSGVCVFPAEGRAAATAGRAANATSLRAGGPRRLSAESGILV